MKKYSKPDITIVTFHNEDIMTISPSNINPLKIINSPQTNVIDF